MAAHSRELTLATPSFGDGGIVEAHAGRAEVRNVQGGCCCSVTLPTA